MTMMRNRPNWTHGHKTVSVPGTAEQLPNIAIPHGAVLAVRALPDNTSTIHMGKSKAWAEDANRRLTYGKGNGLTLQVQNANRVWVDANVADEGVDYWVEQ